MLLARPDLRLFLPDLFDSLGSSYLGGIPRLKRLNFSWEHIKQRYQTGKEKWKTDVPNSPKLQAFSTSL